LAYEALRTPGTLRRLSWQAFIAQWPSDAVLDWLKDQLVAKPVRSDCSGYTCLKMSHQGDRGHKPNSEAV
jgi:hypothetical protein